jgi:hypothetical protein
VRFSEQKKDGSTMEGTEKTVEMRDEEVENKRTQRQIAVKMRKAGDMDGLDASRTPNNKTETNGRKWKASENFTRDGG